MKFEIAHTPMGLVWRCEPYEVAHYEWTGNGKSHHRKPHFRAYVRIDGSGPFGNHVDKTIKEYATLAEAKKACEKHEAEGRTFGGTN